jgi:hypothetical protein
VVKSLGQRVGMINPHKHPSRVLLHEADFMKQVRSGPLGASQFPNNLTDVYGKFYKPTGW